MPAQEDGKHCHAMLPHLLTITTLPLLLYYIIIIIIIIIFIDNGGQEAH